jgi:hypothetical protein
VVLPAVGLVEFELWSRYQFTNVEVAGESHHEAAVRAVLRGQGARLANGESVEIECTARLVPDPRNRHDHNAVEVQVAGHMIGYLPREVAATHNGVLTQLVARGFQPVARCRIWALESQEYQGVDRRGRSVYRPTLHARASLVLDDPELCVPANLPPRGRHRMLPHGSALQVRGEEHHMDVLSPLVGPEGAAWIYATLTALQSGTGRIEKTIVELNVDGRPIGQLTPAMSAHYLPTITHLAETGTAAAAKVLLKGNALKIEAVLHAAKAHELDRTWFDDRPGPASSTATPPPPPSPAPIPAQTSEPAQPQASPPSSRSASVPAKPTRIVFAAPPGWPPPPPGWEPEPGWTAPAGWPPPPEGWQFWVAV